MLRILNLWKKFRERNAIASEEQIEGGLVHVRHPKQEITCPSCNNNQTLDFYIEAGRAYEIRCPLCHTDFVITAIIEIREGTLESLELLQYVRPEVEDERVA